MWWWRRGLCFTGFWVKKYPILNYGTLGLMNWERVRRIAADSLPGWTGMRLWREGRKVRAGANLVFDLGLAGAIGLGYWAAGEARVPYSEELAAGIYVLAKIFLALITNNTDRVKGT
ncbi:MAG: hypothetical protein UY22_C0004G0001 [Candidatus Amesbacteria bacterium GW2011_GWC1_48_10]|uniref:Uncharacterized protein n=3 Tax=Candidatus Amesiibacteriota TaxID=1752730 RepID=A0A0G1ULC6_9BACT|nr:MAG: hypothetical protein UY22_C0004G0001 [Candidatus Amesbacteria bacterium GW2011_GWC1_48_10]